ncbi:CPBP family glutamic-type intramembrane protease [Larkinella soli]|uniref:CPBP family glutamic-type intramembrane protease n=1 Tax=Larkinella soli TaxID=1770527 RepID=UPI000FFBFBC2|nr:CPBP family glutamic-type intramembrane protease [Larkinella soli]
MRIPDFLTVSNDLKSSEEGTLRKLKELIICLILHFSLTILIVIALSILDLCLTDLFHRDSILKSRITTKETYQYYGRTYGIFIISIGAPLIEELAFRLMLSLKKYHVALSGAILFFFLTGPVWKVDDLNFYLLRLFTSLLIFILLIRTWKRLYPGLNEIDPRLIVIILSSALFGGVHIFNFSPLQSQLLYLYPLYVFPQILFGIILSIMRLRNGFFGVFYFMPS